MAPLAPQHEKIVISQAKQIQQQQKLRSTTAAAEEPSWPVQVFRRTEHGWHRMRVTRTATTATSAVAAKTKMTSNKRNRSNSNRSVLIKATPRRNYIALLRLQVRIRLSTVQQQQQQQQSLSAAGSFESSRKEERTPPTTVIRRRHCLLISSNQKLRSLLLRFRDVPSCVAFCDRLALLNPSINSYKSNTNDIISNSNENSREHGTVAESRQVLAYVGSLLHDPDFVQLVDHLEASIAASEDGARMLEALVLAGSGHASNNNDSNRSSSKDHLMINTVALTAACKETPSLSENYEERALDNDDDDDGDTLTVEVVQPICGLGEAVTSTTSTRNVSL